MVTGDKLRDALSKYVPADAVETCVDWIRTHRIRVRIKPARLTKYGDYRSPRNGESHTITINHDLNPYAFLITFTHEVAHLTCWMKHYNNVNPHGEEWKREFRFLLKPFLDLKIFPDDVAGAVANYIRDPAASSCSDPNLMKALRKYNRDAEEWLHLDDLPHSAVFRLRNGKKFLKGHKLRKNYECYELGTNHKYFIPGTLEVKEVQSA